MKAKTKVPKHWYMWCIGECPVCGRDKSYRKRVYGERPEEEWKRVKYLSQRECYDWCDQL